MKKVAYTAPPTGANLGPGFDVLGVAYSGIQGDKVIALESQNFPGARHIGTQGKYASLVSGQDLVQRVANRFLTSVGSRKGFDIILEKNMRIGTGMGSSASSWDATVMAINDLLEEPLPKNDPRILEAVVYGEELATGSRHADNVFPSLLGGFVFITDLTNYSFTRFEGTPNFYFVVASPTNVRIDTKDAREKLNILPYNRTALVKLSQDLIKRRIESPNDKTFPPNYSDVVLAGGSEQNVQTYLAGLSQLIEGIRNGDPSLFGWGTQKDHIITPTRAQLIPGYKDVREAAYLAGAYGFSISGSGPAVFAVTDSMDKALTISQKMEQAFRVHGVQAETYISQPDNLGARRI